MIYQKKPVKFNRWKLKNKSKRKKPKTAKNSRSSWRGKNSLRKTNRKLAIGNQLKGKKYRKKSKKSSIERNLKPTNRSESKKLFRAIPSDQISSLLRKDSMLLQLLFWERRKLSSIKLTRFHCQRSMDIL